MPTGCERVRLAGALLAGLLLGTGARADTAPPDASPIYGVTIPAGYRQ
jgi:hypothetical protein